MPEVAEIKGLSLQMLYRDHEPVHLHVYKHEDEQGLKIERIK